jgi:hypothetical protein
MSDELPGEEFVGIELRRVVPVTMQPPPDSALKLLTVEMYEDGVIVRYAFPNTEEARAIMKGAWHFEMTDDLGTLYWPLGGGASGVGKSAHGSRVFTPAVPADARRLLIRTALGTATVDLSA